MSEKTTTTADNPDNKTKKIETKETEKKTKEIETEKKTKETETEKKTKETEKKTTVKSWVARNIWVIVLLICIVLLIIFGIAFWKFPKFRSAILFWKKPEKERFSTF